MTPKLKKAVFAGIFLAILAAEILIALFVHDGFVRPYLGDVLAVMCVYFFARIFLTQKPRYLSPFVTAFAFAVELLQLTPLSDLLGKGSVLSIIVGGTFDVKDLICYLAGGAICLVLEFTVFSDIDCHKE